MRVKQIPNLNAIEELHETLHLHQFKDIGDMRICSCGKMDPLSSLRIHEEIININTILKILDRFDQDTYVALYYKYYNKNPIKYYKSRRIHLKF